MPLTGNIRQITACLLVALLCLATPRAYAEYNAGLAAYTQLYDYQRAYREFREDGLRGHREAQFYLGEICEGGVGRPVDHEEAFHWYLKSAEQGYGPAQQRLASLYFTGKGVKRNLSKAFEWQKEAAEQGLVIAQYRLGHYYAQGTGVRADPVLAYTWWTIAASWGDPDALSEREKLARSMSVQQIDRALTLAHQYEISLNARRAGNLQE